MVHNRNDPVAISKTDFWLKLNWGVYTMQKFGVSKIIFANTLLKVFIYNAL